jgi:hypothetical protein
MIFLYFQSYSWNSYDFFEQIDAQIQKRPPFTNHQEGAFLHTIEEVGRPFLPWLGCLGPPYCRRVRVPKATSCP